jgi:4a-hydroxytetrahydrobiopterin dehydratase
MNALTKEEQVQRLATLRGWSIKEDILVNHFSFKNFLEAMAFVNTVAELAEELQHHPDITISYNKVAISTTTHDANGLTEKDFSLAKMIGDLSNA